MNTSQQAIQAIGVRCIAEGYNHTDYTDHWKIVRDGSVRDGHEIVSPILVGQQGLDEAIRVANALNAAGASANVTCGLHVHFDASQMSASQVKMICTRYAKFEAQIDAFLPRSRRANNNRYCKSVIENFGTQDFLNATTIEGLVRAQGDRYFKVNLQAYLRHHTIEFRQHSGTVDSQKIKNWVLFLNDFVTESCRMTSPFVESAHKIQKHWQTLIDLISETGTSGMLASEIVDRLGILPHSLRGQISHMRAAGVSIGTIRTKNGSRYYFAGIANDQTQTRNESPNADELFNGVRDEAKAFLNRRARAFAA